jgi:hypothetical protein
MSWLEQIAPGIATALGGPLAGLAVTVISKALGIDEKDVQNTIESGKLTSDQLASIKQAEIELQKQANELGLDFEKLATDDRKSARDMQVATKSYIPAVLAIGVTIGFFGILVGLMTDNVTKSDALLLMLGSLGTAWTAIVSFYFGSSAHSEKQTDMLHRSTPIGQ